MILNNGIVNVNIVYERGYGKQLVHSIIGGAKIHAQMINL